MSWRSTNLVEPLCMRPGSHLAALGALCATHGPVDTWTWCAGALALMERARGPGAFPEGSPVSPSLQGSGLRRFGCPTCRHRTFAGDVAFVQQSGAAPPGSSEPLAVPEAAGNRGHAPGSRASGTSSGAEAAEGEEGTLQEARSALQALEAAERELVLEGSFGTKVGRHCRWYAGAWSAMC